MKKETILQMISGLIAALFFYASFSKLLDYDKSLWEMKNQIFPPAMAWLLTWLIPFLEILLMCTLLFPKTRKKSIVGFIDYANHIHFIHRHCDDGHIWPDTL
ncbi:putative membrane protein YphA (DoxX/SURF4 family) [Pedobacter sp. UYP30]|uniref:MauE/DoxX family redox-associated membrane protein n=1 Tax=Pedobacter sp. UYP30 TaxID=1756400 RepID=UPI0033946F91